MGNLANIPLELQKLSQWVVANNTSKIPINPITGGYASSVNPNSWSSFSTIKPMVETSQYEYAGFVFNNNGIVGVDLDDVFDKHGFLKPHVALIIDKFQSYTEWSKSRNGVHILVKGVLPFKGKNNIHIGVEAYQQSRFFILTGDVFEYGELVENQNAIDWLVSRFFPTCTTPSTTSKNKPISNSYYTPIWNMLNNNKTPVRPFYPLIRDGGRNLSLTSLAGKLHTNGWKPLDIYQELLLVNKTSCKPPLQDTEIQTIVRSITRYKPKQ